MKGSRMIMHIILIPHLQAFDAIPNGVEDILRAA